MKKLRFYVVVDTETNKALRAYESEEKANDFADDLYEMDRQDTLVSEVWAYLED